MIRATYELTFAALCLVWAAMVITPAFGQEPQSTAVLTIEGVINGQAAPPTRVHYVGEAEVAHCIDLTTPGSLAYQETMTALIVSYQALRKWDSGQFKMSCDAWLATRVSQAAEPVAFEAVPVPAP